MEMKGRIFLVAFILFYFIFNLSQAQLTTRFLKPCFEEDKEKEMNFCSDPKNDCTVEKLVQGESKLVRLDGVKKDHVRDIDLGEDRMFKLITKTMKPLMFEIPNFLTDEECDHIIQLAKDTGLHTSIAGFNQSVYDGDLKLELEKAAAQEEMPLEWRFAQSFKFWDRNEDGKIDNEEITHFSGKYKLLFIMEDDIAKMFDQIGFHGYKDGIITPKDFEDLNILMLVTFLDHMKNKHPRYRARYSEQAWLPQNTKSDPALRKLHERVITLTKLPRKVVQGGEALQVVRYGPDGHYHVHYDSMGIPDEYTEAKPCCHHAGPQANGCRLCRFITILYYLNHVEEGGETAFIVADNATFRHDKLTTPSKDSPNDGFNLSKNCHSANMVVAPKKGSAIMWYNHYIDEESGWLGDLDPYSLHGGCDVIKGEKWIANNWLTAPPPGRVDLKSVYDVGF